MKSWLCSDSNNGYIELLNYISPLDPNNIKTDDIRCGEAELRGICRWFNVDELEAIARLRDFKENIKSVPKKLKPLLTEISSLSYSTAECERGFSIINYIITDLRRGFLLISNLSNLMFINVNGIEKFQPKKYSIRSWLVNHRSAIDLGREYIQVRQLIHLVKIFGIYFKNIKSYYKTRLYILF